MNGIVTGLPPPVMLEEGHVMTQAFEADQVLQMVPAQPADRMTDQEAGTQYLQAHRRVSNAASRGPIASREKDASARRLAR